MYEQEDNICPGVEWFADRTFRVEVTTAENKTAKPRHKVYIVGAKSIRKAIAKVRGYCRQDIDGFFQIDCAKGYDSPSEACAGTKDYTSI